MTVYSTVPEDLQYNIVVGQSYTYNYEFNNPEMVPIALTSIAMGIASEAYTVNNPESFVGDIVPAFGKVIIPLTYIPIEAVTQRPFVNVEYAPQGLYFSRASRIANIGELLHPPTILLGMGVPKVVTYILKSTDNAPTGIVFSPEYITQLDNLMGITINGLGTSTVTITRTFISNLTTVGVTLFPIDVHFEDGGFFRISQEASFINGA